MASPHPDQCVTSTPIPETEKLLSTVDTDGSYGGTGNVNRDPEDVAGGNEEQNEEDCCAASCPCCKTCYTACCSPNFKNLWSLVLAFFGVVGLVLNLLMLGDIDDIMACDFTSGLFFSGIILVLLFFTIALVTRCCGYKACFDAHSVFVTLTFLYSYCAGCYGSVCCEGMCNSKCCEELYNSNYCEQCQKWCFSDCRGPTGCRKPECCCCSPCFKTECCRRCMKCCRGYLIKFFRCIYDCLTCPFRTVYSHDCCKWFRECCGYIRETCEPYVCDVKGCKSMTEYREGPLEAVLVSIYIWLNDLIPGFLIALTTAYMDHVNGHVKIIGYKIDHPVVFKLFLYGRPTLSLIVIIKSTYSFYSKRPCSPFFFILTLLGMAYIAGLAYAYYATYKHRFDCECPQFLNNTNVCKL